jgi:Flp pilus assembly protein TadB
MVAGIVLVLSGVLLVWAMGPLGMLLAPFVALGAGWSVANRRANRRRERLREQVQGLSQALSAGLIGEGVTGGTIFTLLRRFYRLMDPPLREEFAFLELVLRGQADLGESLGEAANSAVDKNVRALLELLGVIYRESLDIPVQRRALRTLLERIRQEDQVRRSVRVESRFGQLSQTIVLFLIPGFVVLAIVAGKALGGQVSVLHFYFRTLPGRLIVLAAVVVEGIVMWLSRRMLRRIRWE